MYLGVYENSRGVLRNIIMGIPDREYFDAKGAAEYLGCTLGDIWYYVRHRDGLLRVAIESPVEFLAVLRESSVVIMRELIDFEFSLESLDYPKITLVGDETEGLELDTQMYLYFRWSSLRESLESMYASKDIEGREVNLERGMLVYAFEDIEGREVNLWYDNGDYGGGGEGRLEFALIRVDADREVDKLPKGCLFTLEELERFKGLEKSKDIVDSQESFVLPNKADDIAIAMVSFGNRFVDERGIIPTAMELAGYMLDTGGKELQMTWNNEKERYDVGGKRLTERSFKDRYGKYLKA